jgi:hypothetical protein
VRHHVAHQHGARAFVGVQPVRSDDARNPAHGNPSPSR